jgi:hypothetical protein
MFVEKSTYEGLIATLPWTVIDAFYVTNMIITIYDNNNVQTSSTPCINVW